LLSVGLESELMQFSLQLPVVSHALLVVEGTGLARVRFGNMAAKRGAVVEGLGTKATEELWLRLLVLTELDRVGRLWDV